MVFIEDDNIIRKCLETANACPGLNVTLGDLKLTRDYRPERLYLPSGNVQVHNNIDCLQQQQMLNSLDKGNKHCYGSKKPLVKKINAFNKSDRELH